MIYVRNHANPESDRHGIVLPMSINVPALSIPMESVPLHSVRNDTNHSRRFKVSCARCCSYIFTSKLIYIFPILLFFIGLSTIIMTFIYKPAQNNQNGVKLIIIGGLCICLSLFSFSFIVSFSFICPHLFNGTIINENIQSLSTYSIRNNETNQISTTDQFLSLYATQVRNQTPFADDPPMYNDALKLVINTK